MKKLLAGSVLVLAAGFAALAATFSPQTLPVIEPAATVLPPASPPAGMSLSLLPTGSMGSKAAFAYRGGRFDEPREFVMPVLLIRHPKGDLLIDTGFGRDVDAHFAKLPWLARATSTYTKGVAAGEQLQRAGYPLEKLAGVILTHAHFDHVSGLDSLPGVPVWVNGAEKTFIDGDSPNSALARSFGALNYRLYEFSNAPYLGFDKSLDVWGDGSVVLVPAPGHTPGSTLVFVTLPSGARYALLGDLVWQLEGLEIPTERPWLPRRLIHEDDDAVRHEIGLVAGLVRRFPQLKPVPAHDARATAGWPVFPATIQ